MLLCAALVLPARAVVIDAISGSWTSNPSGTISPANPYDWYTFYGTAGTVVSLGIDAGNFDAYLSLFLTASGPAVAGTDINIFTGDIARDDDSGPGLLPLINNFTLPKTSYYLVLVRGFAPNGGSYGSTFYTGNITAGPVANNTPDAGSTFALLGLCVGVLGIARRILAA